MTTNFMKLTLAATVVGLLMTGCGLISNSIAIATSGLSNLGVSKQVTKQVAIHETNETERTWIQAVRDIRIEEIKSETTIRKEEIKGDTKRLTSGWGLMHRGYDDLRSLVIGGTLALTVLLLFVVVLYVVAYRRRERY